MTGPREPDRQASPLDPSGELRTLASDCVHCGFCLPSCPTYQLWGEEMDSPRGRIHLITQILDGAGGGAATATHLDRCLGCMACVTACPSGVRYDRLIEAARVWAAEPRCSRRTRQTPAARTGPAPAAAVTAGPGAPGGHLQPVPLPAPAQGGHGAAARRPADARGRADRPQRPGRPAEPGTGGGPAAGPAAPPGARHAGRARPPQGAARAHQRLRFAARHRRHADRVRAAGLFPAGQRGHGRRAGRRGMRRGDPGRPGLLRRAVPARRPQDPRRSPSPGGRSRRSSRRAWTRSSSTWPAAARP